MGETVDDDAAHIIVLRILNIPTLYFQPPCLLYTGAHLELTTSLTSSPTCSLGQSHIYFPNIMSGAKSTSIQLVLTKGYLVQFFCREAISIIQTIRNYRIL